MLRQGGGVQVFMQDARGLAALRFIEGADSVVPVADPPAAPHGACLSPCAVCCTAVQALLTPWTMSHSCMFKKGHCLMSDEPPEIMPYDLERVLQPIVPDINHWR